MKKKPEKKDRPRMIVEGKLAQGGPHSPVKGKKIYNRKENKRLIVRKFKNPSGAEIIRPF